uniref:DNA replication licensing factor MCM3 n=3 Tax=Acrobeloides nanus TaxID=290746 RepID=A0A914CBQ2_9BILA
MAIPHNFALINVDDEARMREITQEYSTFLDDSTDEKIYTQKIQELIDQNGKRLVVNLNHVRAKLPDRCAGLLHNFVEEILCFEKALKEVVSHIDATYAKDAEFQIGFEGSFGDRHVNPRTLKSRFLGNLVCCEGIVTRCTSVRPKVVKSVHYCPATKKTLEKKYTDFTSYDTFPTSNAYPTEDENKNPLETEFGLSVYKDHQLFSIQELPETAPPGQLPRSIDVIADDDLSDRCKPGDRVRVIGLFRVLPNKQGGVSTGNFRSVLISNNIQLLSKELQPQFDNEDIRNIRRMSKNKDIFEILARSLAPSIYGHEEVKKAILCLSLGGCEKILDNGTRLRGDINVLLIGDPSVAKSQLLRYVLHTAPRAIATTGRGSSGVGLTAAVTTDHDSGERRLEAGAMVLADRGIVCIDEFDKMSDIDRTAIHEVMEQGRVSISKAGIHAKLNARCSVLAAANPVYGRYNLYKTPMDNIGMQDSLLSRFDLIFVILDEHDIERDKSLAENVLKLHRYRTPGEPDGTVLPIGAALETLSTFDNDHDEPLNSTDIYEKNRGWTAVPESQKIVSSQFMRKYIHMAKAVKPTLSEAASEYISECYSILRSFDTSKTDRERTMPVTARQLETLIRLSTAMAKARLAKTVEKSDAEKAYQLLHFACFKEKPKERLEAEERRHHRDGNTGEGGESDTEENENVTHMDTTSTHPTRATRYAKRRAGEEIESTEPDTFETQDSVEPAAKRPHVETPAISIDRYESFKRYLRVAFDETGRPDDLWDVNVIKNSIQRQAGVLTFSEGEFEAAFSRCEADNIAMVANNQITLI